MANSHIEWTEKTWNPTTGCTKVSQGCKHCYAEVMSKRLKAMGLDKYKNEFKLALHPELLDAPRKWKPSTIFVNSMSDLFHEDIPVEFLQQTFQVMNECPHHQFQVLTKRAGRLEELSPILNWSSNIWMGVSVENQDVVSRIEQLKRSNASIKFLSLEPLIGELPDLPLEGIDWVIVGGESGRKARSIEKSWVLDIRDQCSRAGVAFFFKQWGGERKKVTGRILEGKTYDEMPKLRVFAPAVSIS